MRIVKETVPRRALTIMEVLCVVVMVFIVLGWAMLSLAKFRARTSKVKCVNNLKNLGLAYRIFATDNGDRFPFEFSTNTGGSQEFTNDIVAQFLMLTNELGTPKILSCHTRRIQQWPATSWTNLTRTNISYYVNLSASQARTNSVLSGDAGFEIQGLTMSNRLVTVGTSDRILYPARFHGKTSLANLVLADGSAQQFSFNSLTLAIQKSNVETNRFLIP